MSRLVGVDLGATEVRVAEVTGVDADGRAIVSKMGFSPVGEGAIVAGRIRNPSSVAMALVRALKEAGVPRRGFVLGMASPDVAMTRQLISTAVKKAEREQVLRVNDFQVSATTPLDESTVSTQRVQTLPSDGGQSVDVVAVAAALNSEVEALQAVCRLANVQPRAIDLSGAALLRSLTRTSSEGGEVATIVDLGASKITVATREGLHMRSLRTIPGGGLEITRSLMSVTEDDFEAAEARKSGLQLATTRAFDTGPSYGFGDEAEHRPDVLARRALEDALSSAVDVMVESIAQSIDSDTSAQGVATQGITLCGGTSRLPGLKARVQQRTGVPVLIGKPWVRIERSRHNALHLPDGQEDPVKVMNLAVAVGLALWKEPS